tara:strand:- start:8387 stop:8617 length:231 start_codon:yes stop_codon:yes gene_type:complete
MEAKKTTPKSIRFNIIDLDIALNASGAQSVQQLVDFILSNYVKDSVVIIDRQVPDSLNKEPLSSWEILRNKRLGIK